MCAISTPNAMTYFLKFSYQINGKDIWEVIIMNTLEHNSEGTDNQMISGNPKIGNG